MNKSELIKNYKNEDNIFASNIIDQINKFSHKSKPIYTNFLNTNQYNIAKSLLNKTNTPFLSYDLNQNLEKKNIILTKEKTDPFDHVVALKIINKGRTSLEHREYMGAIYNIGIKDTMISDIFVFDNYAITFIISDIVNYFINNLTLVSNNQVEIEIIEKEDIDITQNFQEKTFTVNSYRMDIILGKLYNLSRNKINDHISKNNCYVNSNLMKNNSYTIKENDIISLRKYGKIKIISFNTSPKNKNLITVNIYM